MTLSVHSGEVHTMGNDFGRRAGKVTVVGAGFYGSTTAQRLAEYDNFDTVVLTDIIEGKPEGLALDLNQSRPVEGFETTGVRFDSVLGARTIPWDEVAAIFVEVLSSAPAPAEATRVPVSLELAGADGGRLRGGLVALERESCRLILGGRTEVKPVQGDRHREDVAAKREGDGERQHGAHSKISISGTS